MQQYYLKALSSNLRFLFLSSALSYHPTSIFPFLSCQINSDLDIKQKINFGHQISITINNNQSMLLSRRFGTFLNFAKNRVRFIQAPLPLSKLYAPPKLYFSSSKVTEKMEFKAETKKLLDIVAKSLYTDSEVFLRELLSNASDALEKQRFLAQSNQQLTIQIEAFPQKKQLVIQDNGIGMSKQDLINNLGTIAKSGSKQFMQKIQQEGRAMQNNIIGQFGVGFYSSFIIADQVEVISRVTGQNAYKWTSDGSGTFQISESQENTFERGTKIILHVKQEHKNFLDNTELQKIAQKYSNFINFPISLNGEALNLVKALWSRDRKDISEKEYQDFYEYLSGKTEKYQYKMHFVSDVPLELKAVLYIPQLHTEKFTGALEKSQISLYSKKVLIKKNCKQLLPNFLRFVKGVVDCEDIPLNISRQSYQDSALMAKIKRFITKKIIKQLKDESEKDPVSYSKWYNEFEIFIKEGSIEPQYKKQVSLLNRYFLNIQQGQFNLKDYISLKKPTQDRIFYMFSPNRNSASDSPYVYPLTKAGVPVLIANTHLDQVIFRQLDTFEGLKFANIETDTQQVQRTLNGLEKDDKESKGDLRIKQQQLTPFSLWIKQNLQPFVDKVNVSKKPIKGPALVISPISSSMRQMSFMRQMMQQRSKNGLPKMSLQNLTFQFDPTDPLIVKLNNFRKINESQASAIVKQVFDNCCIEAGLESDAKNMIKRINSLMEGIIDDKISSSPSEPQK